MKRDKNLETLSWEHHDGLVLAFRLEKSIKNNVSSSILSDYILHHWEQGLRHHFWQEEQVLQAPLSKFDEGKKLLHRMIEEHAQLKNLISDIKSNGKDIKSNIEQFYQYLNKHIRFEERQLFPLVEELISSEELEKIGGFLHKHHEPGKKEWHPEFWKD